MSRLYAISTRFGDIGITFGFTAIALTNRNAKKNPNVKLPEPPLEQKNEPLPEIKEPIFLTDDYNPAAAASFMEIAASNDGLLQYSKGPETLLDDIKKILENITPKENHGKDTEN